MRRLLLVLFFALSLAADDRLARVERGLLPPVLIEGGPAWTIEERLRHHELPGISIAIVEDGRIVAAKGYGFADAQKKRPMTTGTLLLAGSISKPVTAMAAIDLVERGRLPLDADVNTLLRSWQLPSNELTARTPVTLRQLLSHSAGTTVHGFPGYARDLPVPTVPQILDGVAPANTPPVRVDLAPNTKFRYSGGGTTIAQLALVDTTGSDFPTLMRRHVLGPLGMRASTYANPLPPSRHDEAAVGYRLNLRPIPGGWHVYPEMAAAGLWTTPSELARVIVEMHDALAGRPSRVLSIDGARLMLTPRFPIAPKQHIGIGFIVEDRGYFSHNGSDEGFQALLLATKDGRKGAVVMGNADGSFPLIMEVVRSIARAYDWPDYLPATRASVATPMEVLNRLPGRYRQDANRILAFRRAGERLEVRNVDGSWVPLYALEDGTLARTDRDERYRVTDAGIDILVGDKPTAVTRTEDAPAPHELLGDGQIAEGIAALRAAKPDVQTFNRLGLTFLNAKKRREAIAILRLATELHPDSAQVWDNYANALLAAGELEAAVPAVKNALARVDTDAKLDEQMKFWLRLNASTRLHELRADR